MRLNWAGVREQACTFLAYETMARTDFVAPVEELGVDDDDEEEDDEEWPDYEEEEEEDLLD